MLKLRFDSVNSSVLIALIAIAFSLLPSFLPPVQALENQKLFGVTISGAEFTDNNIPGTRNTHYIYPSSTNGYTGYSYFKNKGLMLIRIPFRWERVQNESFGSLSAADIADLTKMLDDAHSQNQMVILDLHNYARYYNQALTRSDASKLADVWKKLAIQFQTHPALWGYELMNEPHDLPEGEESWLDIAQASVNAIREVDTTHYILIPGVDWQSADRWPQSSDSLKNITDPSDATKSRIIYAAHQYFDNDASGVYSSACSNQNIGVTRVQNFINWLNTNNAKGILTEYGVPGGDTCWLHTLSLFLDTLRNSPHIVGGTYWSAGPWWGNYPLSVEPSEGVDKPQIEVLTSPPPDSFTGKYFNNRFLNGDPVVIRYDQNIDFNYGDGSPDAAVAADNFSVRWSKNQYFDEGLYNFYVKADDGIRVYVDNELVIDKWIDQGATEYNELKSLSSGNHDIKVEYYENGGDASVRFSWYPVESFKGEYFSNISASGTPSLVNYDKTINFNWFGNSPLPSLPSDNFSVRWTKLQSFQSGLYNFYARADDGVRVSIDNNVLIDGWKDQSSTSYNATKTLSSGNHDLKVEYYDSGADANIAFSWYEVIPDANKFKGEYFNNRTLSGEPILTKYDDVINFYWGSGSADNNIPFDNFSARWTKNQSFAAGTYNFYVKADDGVRVYVDEQLLIDKWIDQSTSEYNAVKTLSAGDHNIKVEYYEHGGDATMVFSWYPIE